ncbi:hypothetical protein BJV77DRAFT_464187 [Russula vinacea]|nr:hypothetical protein BJV77DRAFT_464187 [Russula vinacea]
MLIPSRRMLHVHPHAPDLAQSRSTRLVLLARVGVAVGVRLRSSDNSSWRLEPFSTLCLSLSLMAACAGVLAAVLGAFISFFIGSFDPWSCFFVVSFLLYLSSSEALHSLILVRSRSLLSSHFLSVSVSPSYSMFVFI